jgi:hypothetical protein
MIPSSALLLHDHLLDAVAAGERDLEVDAGKLPRELLQRRPEKVGQEAVARGYANAPALQAVDLVEPREQPLLVEKLS